MVVNKESPLENGRTIVISLQQRFCRGINMCQGRLRHPGLLASNKLKRKRERYACASSGPFASSFGLFSVDCILIVQRMRFLLAATLINIEENSIFSLLEMPVKVMEDSPFSQRKLMTLVLSQDTKKTLALVMLIILLKSRTILLSVALMRVATKKVQDGPTSGQHAAQS